ncbi:MAG: stage II sporulation protein M, partial [Gammaproteobacteria bacterium]
MKQQQFIEQQRPLWDAFKQILDQMAQPPRRRNSANLGELPALYRSVCADYAMALHRHYSTGLVDELHDLVLRGHGVLYRHKSIWLWRILTFFWVVFPATLRRHARIFWLATALVYLPYIVIGGLAYFNNDIIYSLMTPSEVANMEYMYDPGNPAPWRAEERASSTNFAMFGLYIYNNISIGFRTFATGMLAGIGTVLTLLFNGAVLGAVSGHLTQLGFIDTFWPFVAGHSAFELT